MTSSTTAAAEARPTLLNSNACLIGLDDERLAAVGAAGHDERDLEDGQRPGDRQDDAQADDRPMPGSDDVAELLPAVGAVDLRRLVSCGGIDWMAPRNSTKLRPM